jgi:hypothetical protein
LRPGLRRRAPRGVRTARAPRDKGLGLLPRRLEQTHPRLALVAVRVDVELPLGHGGVVVARVEHDAAAEGARDAAEVDVGGGVVGGDVGGEVVDVLGATKGG